MASPRTDTRNRVTAIRPKKGAKPSTSLKELSGTVTARVLGEAKSLVSVADVLEAAGKTVKGTEGGSIHLLAVKKEQDGRHTFRLEVELPAGPVARTSSRGDRVLLGSGDAADRSQHELTLADRDGNLLAPVDLRLNAGARIELQISYQLRPGQGAPSRLALVQRKSVSVELPFTLRNVPMP
jgi:hypothetical protein